MLIGAIIAVCIVLLDPRLPRAAPVARPRARGAPARSASAAAPAPRHPARWAACSPSRFAPARRPRDAALRPAAAGAASCRCSGAHARSAACDGPVAATFPPVTADTPIEKKPLPTGGICHLCRHLRPQRPASACAARRSRTASRSPIRAGVVDHRKPHPATAGSSSSRRTTDAPSRPAQRAGSSTCSIESAFIALRAAHEHAHEPGVVLGGLVALVHVRDEAADRLLLAHADDAAARAGHADVGDVGGAAGQHARVGGRHVRVGADDRAHAAVEIPARARPSRSSPRRGSRRARGRTRPVELAERDVDVGERRAPGAQEEVAAEVHDAEPHAAGALHDADAVAGLAAQVVVGPQDRLVRVEVGEDLAPVVGVVAERDDVDAGGEQLVGDLRRDARGRRRRSRR